MSRVISCEQGSAEWHKQRAGVLTASMVGVIRNKLTNGEYSKAAEKYAFRIALERITGKPLDDTFETEYMRRGNRLEEEARVLHEQRIGDLIEQTGLVLSDCGRFGASPDGLIRSDGGAEYKCFVSPEKLMPILIHGDVSEIQDQMQMNMWLTEREWWHFGLYCPALKPVERELTIIPVMRDDAYIEALRTDLYEFDCLVDEYKQALIDNNHDSIFMPEEKLPEPDFIPASPAADIQYDIQL